MTEIDPENDFDVIVEAYKSAIHGNHEAEEQVIRVIKSISESADIEELLKSYDYLSTGCCVRAYESRLRMTESLVVMIICLLETQGLVLYRKDKNET